MIAYIYMMRKEKVSNTVCQNPGHIIGNCRLTASAETERPECRHGQSCHLQRSTAPRDLASTGGYGAYDNEK